MHTMNVGDFSHPSNSMTMVDHGIAMGEAGHSGSNVKCDSCQGVRHPMQDCATLTGKEYRYRASHRVQAQRNQHTPHYRTGS